LCLPERGTRKKERDEQIWTKGREIKMEDEKSGKKKKEAVTNPDKDEKKARIE
jgi:hypothetical protein